MSLNVNKKLWLGGNLLLGFCFFLSLFISCFISNWGLIQESHFQIFYSALIIYFFARILPLNWIISIWLLCLILIIYLDLNYWIYFFNLIIGIFFLRQRAWFLWALAPIFIHGLSALFIIFYENNLISSFYKITILSKQSLLAELLLVYPLIYLGELISKIPISESAKE